MKQIPTCIKEEGGFPVTPDTPMGSNCVVEGGQYTQLIGCNQ